MYQRMRLYQSACTKTFNLGVLLNMMVKNMRLPFRSPYYDFIELFDLLPGSFQICAVGEMCHYPNKLQVRELLNLEEINNESGDSKLNVTVQFERSQKVKCEFTVDVMIQYTSHNMGYPQTESISLKEFSKKHIRPIFMSITIWIKYIILISNEYKNILLVSSDLFPQTRSNVHFNMHLDNSVDNHCQLV